MADFKNFGNGIVVVLPLNRKETIQEPTTKASPGFFQAPFCQIPKETMNNVRVSENSIIPINWKEKRIYNLEELGPSEVESFVTEWKSHGFVVVRLGKKIQVGLKELLEECCKFFAMDEETKLQHRYTLERYIGYSQRKDLLKEFFQVRYCTPEIEPLIWSNLPNMQSFKQSCFNTFHQLQSIAHRTFELLMTYLGASPSYIQQFFERGLDSGENISQCVLEVFHYFGKNSPLCHDQVFKKKKTCSVSLQFRKLFLVLFIQILE